MEERKKLSVVITNWARPRNVLRFIEEYAQHDRVAEVIVWDPSINCSLDSYEPGIEGLRDNKKIRYVRSTHDFGLYGRFAAATLSQQFATLIVDDDIELPAGTVTALHDAWMADPDVLHGIFGRQPSRSRDCTYPSDYQHGPVQVLLTRAVVASTLLIAHAMPWGMRHLRDLPGEPAGNGEDILLSHVAMSYSKRLNLAYKVPFRNVNYDDDNAISVRFKDHKAHRTRMVKWCRSLILNDKVPVK